MKSVIAAVVIFIILIVVAFQDRAHQILKAEIIEFMAAGDRNTGSDGFERDLQIAELEARLFNLETNCEK